MLKRLTANEFAPALAITNPEVLANPSKLASLVNVRLVKIGLGVTCKRCGGSGQYSFNLMDGTKCYGCNGYGEIPPKLTQETLVQATAAVSEGKLAAYLHTLQLRATMKRNSPARRAEELCLKYRKYPQSYLNFAWDPVNPYNTLPNLRKVTKTYREWARIEAEMLKLVTDIAHEENAVLRGVFAASDAHVATAWGLFESLESNLQTLAAERDAILPPTVDELLTAVTADKPHMSDVYYESLQRNISRLYGCTYPTWGEVQPERFAR